MKRLVVGNWKLYIRSLDEGKKLLKQIDAKFPRGVKMDIVICAPVFLAAALRREYKGKRIAIGTQDTFWETEGPYTGTISPAHIKSSGIDYVLVGHSERRALGDNDEIVSKKAVAALAAKLHPIICVGELERDTDGKFFSAIAKSVKGSLARIEPAHAGKITVAYEPVWAIGSKEAASPRVAAEAILYIRKTIADMWGRDKALKVRIIYGAAVDAENAKLFSAEKNIQGLLPGRASTDASEFTGIIKAFS
jgi:triosephosphate isomerase